MIGIVILSKDNEDELFKCLRSIKDKTHCDYRIYLGDTGSTDIIKENTVTLLKELFDDEYKFIEFVSYKFTKRNNDIIFKYVDDDVDTVVFCNNDIEIITDGLIDRMYNLKNAHGDKIGTIGCRLLYPNNTIQHDGQIVVIPTNRPDDVIMAHMNQHKPESVRSWEQPVKTTGNTFALCMTDLSLFKRLGGLNEVFRDCFDDVYFNLQCLMDNRTNALVESRFKAYHHESLTRGKGVISKDMIHDYHTIKDFIHGKFMKEQKHGDFK